MYELGWMKTTQTQTQTVQSPTVRRVRHNRTKNESLKPFPVPEERKRLKPSLPSSPAPLSVRNTLETKDRESAVSLSLSHYKQKKTWLIEQQQQKSSMAKNGEEERESGRKMMQHKRRSYHLPAPGDLSHLRELFRHHIESFDYLVTAGLGIMLRDIKPVQVHNPLTKETLRNILSLFFNSAQLFYIWFYYYYPRFDWKKKFILDSYFTMVRWWSYTRPTSEGTE